MSIGKRILDLRKKRALTQAELAGLIFVSPKTVSKWENGYGLPDIKMLPKIAEALDVDCNYLLTGDITLPTKAEESRPIESQVKPTHKNNEDEIPANAYRLRLYQVTHNHLTKWVLLVNILVLILAIVCGPIDLKLGHSNGYGSTTVLAMLYEQITVSSFSNSWVNAICVAWIIVLTYTVLSSIIMIIGTMNGTNEYYVKTAMAQFIAIFCVFVLSVIGSSLSNLYEGETVVRIDIPFICMLVLASVQLMLNILISKHGKPIKWFKCFAAIAIAFLVAAASVGYGIPNGVARQTIDESTVAFSEAELEVRERRVQSFDTSWYEYSGSCVIAVKANAKVTYLYDGTVKFATGNYIQTLFVNNEYLKTKYVDKNYCSFFKVSFTASGKDDKEAPERIEKFNLSFSVIDGGKVFELTTNTEILRDNTVDFAEALRIGGELETGRFNAIYGVYLKKEAHITGWEAPPATDLAVYTSSVEYTVSGEVGGKDVFIPEYTSDWKSLKNYGEDIAIPLKWQKYGGNYAEVGIVQIKIEVLTLNSLKQTARVKLFTDIGTVIISLPIDVNYVIDSYA